MGTCRYHIRSYYAQAGTALSIPVLIISLAIMITSHLDYRSCTYAQFHWMFTTPLLCISVYLAGRVVRVGTVQFKAYGIALALTVCIALVYTIPWDRYMIKKGVWGYEAVVGEEVSWDAAFLRPIPLEEIWFVERN